MKIRFAQESDLETIHFLAEEIWWNTYKGILSDEQISFMLQDMYSLEALRTQLRENTLFILAEENNEAQAFASYSNNSKEKICKIHKLYIHPSQQGKGLGRKLLAFIENEAKGQKLDILELNVNSENPAYNFYLKSGFEVFKEIDIPYHQYILNDYIMRRAIK